ncbi:MAG: hypothetical protein NVSMB9_27920 [Isosphaeraceae bacterium]
MIRRNTIRFVAVLTFVLALPSFSLAAYTWPTVIPANGATNVAQPVQFGATLNWTAGTTILSMNTSVSVVGGYTGKTTLTTTTNSGSGQATWKGDVKFDPPLASGKQVTVTFDVMMSDFTAQTESTTFTIK